MSKSKIILATTVIALSAGGGGFAASQSDKSNAGEAKEIEVARTAPVSLPQAIAAAESQSNGRAVAAEAEENDSQVLYEIKTIGGDQLMVLRIDPQTGDVVETMERVEDSDADAYAGAAELGTTLAAAIASAEQATGGKAIEAGLHHDDGKALYKVELAASDGTVYKTYVDAASGEVVDDDDDDDDSDDDDKKD